MSRKVIESWLPLDALGAAATNEARSARGTPGSLHLWWGNRQTAIARGLVFAQLVDMPEDEAKRREVQDVLAGLLNDNPLVEQRAVSLIGGSCGEAWPCIHDPFCGIGTIPFAALSLSVPATGCDLNPLAAFVARTATGPVRSDLEPIDVKRAIAWVACEMKNAVGRNYPHVNVTSAMVRGRPELAKYCGRELPVKMWLWVRTVPDPNPAFSGVSVPLATSFVACAQAGRESWLECIPNKSGKGYSFAVRSGEPPSDAARGTRSGKAEFRSVMDGNAITADYIREQARSSKMGARMIAVFAEGDDGETLVLPATQKQMKAADVEKSPWTPAIPVPGNTRHVGPAVYGAKTYGEMFLPRQTQALAAVSEAILRYAALGEKEAAAAHVLAIAFSNFTTWHSTANTYWNGNAVPRNVFARPVIPPTWDFVEANPVECSTKRWEEIAHGVCDRFFSMRRVAAGGIFAADARSWRPGGGFRQDLQDLQDYGTPGMTDVVVNTELPYYDNVAYADLADFMYGWVRPCIAKLEPDLALSESCPRQEEIAAFAYRHSGRDEADRFYRSGIERALANIASYSRGDYPSVFGFDFRSATFTGRDAEPLAAFIGGLVSAGFVITAVWPLKDVRAHGVFGSEAKTGFRSIYFVCRRRTKSAETASRVEFVRRLDAELPQGLEEYRRLDSNLGGGDYAAAAVGLGLKLYSSYRDIMNADGTRFGVGDAIEAILAATSRIKAKENSRCCGDFSMENSRNRGIDGQKKFSPVSSVLPAEKTSVPHPVLPAENNQVAALEEALRSGLEDEQTLRRMAVDAYEKAEAAGRELDAAIWNDLLNRWDSIIEEKLT